MKNKNLFFPPCRTEGAVIAGAVIAAVVICSLIVGALYYVFSVRGYNVKALSWPSKSSTTVDVVSPEIHTYCEKEKELRGVLDFCDVRTELNISTYVAQLH